MKNVIIFGDSYSTFEGELPEKHTFYYPKMDVAKKEDTWWWQFFKRSGYKLIYNDSWSGSTIGYTGYNNYDCSKSSSFICRYKKLKNDGYFNNKDVDLIIVFGGSNDSWSDAPLGEMMFSDWKEEDLYKVLPAISYFLSSLRNDFPNSEILFVINNGIKNEMKDSIITYSKFYGFKYVELHDIEKINDHPTKNGMNAICNQILSEV